MFLEVGVAATDLPASERSLAPETYKGGERGGSVGCFRRRSVS